MKCATAAEQPARESRYITQHTVDLESASAVMRSVLGVLSICAALLQPGSGLDNGVARKPQMGFAPWNFAGVHSTSGSQVNLPHSPAPFSDGHWPAVSEKLMKDMADSLVDLGLANLGYVYLCVDGEHVAFAGKALLAHGVCKVYRHCPQVQLATHDGLQPLPSRVPHRGLPQMLGLNQRGTMKGILWPTRPHSPAA